MRVERIKRWQWVVLSVLVGLALAYAFRADLDNLPSRLGEGVADQRWFERQVQRRVTLADGSMVPAFGRLTVYPLTIQDRTGRRPVHVVAGMLLAHVEAAPDASEVSDATTRPSAGLAGKLRPYFFIAPVPYTPLAARQSGRPAGAGATVRNYLDGLRDKGVTYTYAWWADARYATATWVVGSVLVIGLLWPTAVNLIAFGTFRTPAAEPRGINLWKVKASVVAARSAPVASVPQAAPPAPASPAAAVSSSDPDHDHDRAAPHLPVPVLAAGPAEAAAVAGHEQKEFGAKRDDFYPTELKVHPHKPVPVGPAPAPSGGGRHDE